jgi:hypothetical protein
MHDCLLVPYLSIPGSPPQKGQGSKPGTSPGPDAAPFAGSWFVSSAMFRFVFWVRGGRAGQL